MECVKKQQIMISTPLKQHFHILLLTLLVQHFSDGGFLQGSCI